MITVRGRTLIIPESEKQIGTTYDNNSEVRHIRISRVTSGGIDIANLNFRLDLEYADKVLDTCLLDVEVGEEYILLTWTIPDTCIAQMGTVWIAVRAYDENGTVKWATNRGFVYVGHTIFDGDRYTGKLTELEQLEERIRQRTETLDANEGARQEAESQRQLNEEARLNNEAEWQRQAETAITEANTTLEMATEKAEIAKREAATATAKAKEAGDSAEAAGLSKDKAEMAANTAITKAQEVQTNVDAAVELKELSLQAAITATDKAAEANASAERAESSTTLILQAEATVTKTAAQVKADAKTAADSRDIAVSEATKATEKASQADASAKEVQRIVEGLGGFDGTAEHVLAIDTQGIAGDAGGTSNVQALLNVLAQKVALELVSNSALATMLSGYIAKSCIKNTGLVTEEGFVADARQLNPEIADTLAARVKKNAEDIVTANSNLGEHFSEAERQIGTWMGKPLYRQCFHPTVDIAAGTQSYNISLGLSGVEVAMIDYAHTWCMGSSNTDVYCIPYVHNDAVNNVGAFLIVENADVKFAIRKGTNTSIRSIWITLTYTKTTDS